MTWNKTEYKKFINNLLDNQDIKYKEFSKRIITTKYNMIGIRTPQLKKYAKEIKDPISFLNIVENNYYEEVMLELLVISNLKDLSLIDKYINRISKIDNWALCDTMCSNFKIVKKHKEHFLKHIEKFLKDKHEYTVRFGIVLLLDYYIEDEYIDKIFSLIDNINREEYYIKMANAWLISILLIKYYEKTINYLKTSNLDTFTYNKALQKAIESYRITKENKDILRNLKRKN